MSVHPILAVRHLKTHFFTPAGLVRAVDDVSFSLVRGKTLGIVGESGSGKSLTALSILKLVPPPGKIADGQVLYSPSDAVGEPVDLVRLTPLEIRRIRGREISMVFQEPMTALNPVFTIGNQISEAIRAHEMMSHREAKARTIEIMRSVTIPLPEQRFWDYPHQLSGGLRQRAMIAMALVTKPKLLIADEPTTALDVTIQAQILDLMTKLKEELGMAIILITHNLGVIAETVKRVIVRYAGKIVEEAKTKTLFENPQHPYTMGLLKSIPRLGDKFRYGKVRLSEIPGVVPSLYKLPSGCKFSTRCPSVMNLCREKEPELREIGEGHYCSCWLTVR